MARRGRPRAQTIREPNGRASRSLRKLVNAELTPEGPLSRLELHRLFANWRSAARLEQFGAPIGQLLLAGKIDADQYRAGRMWDVIAQRYLAAISAPNPDPPAMRLEPRSGFSPAFVAHAAGRAAQARFSDGLVVLLGSGPPTVRAVRQCCEGKGRYPVGFEELQRLREGLLLLARHWRLTAEA